MTYRKTHGPAVRVIRDALGIKHGAFAVDCLISPGYLTNIEKGHKQPSPEVTRKMAERLGVSLDSITYAITLEDALAVVRENGYDATKAAA